MKRLSKQTNDKLDATIVFNLRMLKWALWGMGTCAVPQIVAAVWSAVAQTK